MQTEPSPADLAAARRVVDRYLPRAQRLQEPAGAVDIEPRVVRFDTQEETVPACESEVRIVFSTIPMSKRNERFLI